MTPLRIAFMGTPDFAVPALAAIAAAGHTVPAVYTQPPRPAGRGKKPRPSPVALEAERLGLEVRTPAGLKDVAEQDAFAALDLDMAIVAAYGLILPQPILDAPRLGCVNIHASLLPRWRGAAPIQRAIWAGDMETGISIMRMEAGLDTGPVYTQRRIDIGADGVAGSVHDALAALGAEMIVPAIEGIVAGTLAATPQPEAGVTYAKKVDKAETAIDWTQPADAVDRQVRALSPFPGAWFAHDGQRVKVLAGAVVSGDGTPGLVLDDRLTVACGKAAYRPAKVQRAGKAAMSVEELLRGFPVPKGTQLMGPQ